MTYFNNSKKVKNMGSNPDSTDLIKPHLLFRISNRLMKLNQFVQQMFQSTQEKFYFSIVETERAE